MTSSPSSPRRRAESLRDVRATRRLSWRSHSTTPVEEDTASAVLARTASWSWYVCLANKSET